MSVRIDIIVFTIVPYRRGYPVTFPVVLNRWRTAEQRAAGARIRAGASVIGLLAALAMAVVGCTSIIGGTATLDTEAAPAYRSSVSASVSASAATSSIRETQRQQSLTTQKVRGSCGRFAETSSDAIDATNKYVEAFNSGGDVSGTAGPAADSLIRSADETTAALNDALPANVRDALTAYADSARSVASAISGKAC